MENEIVNPKVSEIIKCIGEYEQSTIGYETPQKLFLNIYNIVEPEVEQFNADYQVENYLNNNYENKLEDYGIKNIDGDSDDLSDEDYEDKEQPCKCDFCGEQGTEKVRIDEGENVFSCEECKFNLEENSYLDYLNEAERQENFCN